MTSSINKGNNRYPVFHRVINNLLALTVLDARVSGPGRKVANIYSADKSTRHTNIASLLIPKFAV